MMRHSRFGKRASAGEDSDDCGHAFRLAATCSDEGDIVRFGQKKLGLLRRFRPFATNGLQ
jgi:hypothetical protein